MRDELRVALPGDERPPGAPHRQTVAAYDLPMNLPPGVGAEDVLPLFARDKKAIQGVTFVLDGPNGVEQVKGIDERHLRDALEALRP